MTKVIKVVKVGTRPSPLALKQVEEAIKILNKIYPEAVYRVRKIFTTGDRDKITPISEVEGTDFFTKEIGEALLKDEIDIAIHSAKDIPETLPKGLKVIYETKSLGRHDALVSRGDIKFEDLPAGARVGVSSKRRKDQIRRVRPDLKAVDIRGTIEERLKFMDDGRIDALIVAHAALIRLGLQDRIAEILPLDIFKTHPKQGRLSFVAREGLWAKAKFI